MPIVAINDKDSSRNKKAINAIIAELLDIISILILGPMSLKAVKRNVSPITNPIIPLNDKNII
jgi:hypothetical protein